MEANPSPTMTVGEQFYRALIKIAKKPEHPVAFTVTINVDVIRSKDLIISQLDSTVKLFNGDVTYSNFRLDSNDSSSSINIDVGLNEPAFSNHYYANYRVINDRKIVEWLKQSNYGKPINPNVVYTCRLVIKANTSDVYLSWDDGEELLYRFGSMASNRYAVFKYLLENSDMKHDLNPLKDKLVVPQSTKTLHEYFTKTFIVGNLKDKFAIVSEKKSIGIKSIASFKGTELISVIRNNLKQLKKSQFRHIERKLRQELVNGRPTHQDSAEDQLRS